MTARKLIINKIDEFGHAFKELHANEENYGAIQRLLPELLEHIQFSGKVWSLPYVSDLEGVPLFIANRPVLLPLPPSPASTYPGLFARPKDPLSEWLDPLVVLTEHAVRVALETFKEANAFLVFFNGAFVAVYDDDAKYEDVIDFIPETFGGLRVSMTNHQSIFPSASGNREISPKGPEPGPARADVSDQKHAFRPGERIYVHGPRFCEPDSQVSSFGNPLYMDATGCAGVLIRMDGEEYLTTTTHTSVLFAKKCRKATYILDRIASATGSIKDEWKTAVWTGNEERVKVCKLPDCAIRVVV